MSWLYPVHKRCILVDIGDHKLISILPSDSIRDNLPYCVVKYLLYAKL